MSEKKPHPPRRWLKRIGFALLGLLILLVLFHRPIFFEGTRYFIVRAAKQQNLNVDYEMSGSIFSTLTISNFKATPAEPGPIQRLEAGTINLQYSLYGLIRNGIPAFLKTVEMKNVFVELTPGERPPPAKEQKPQKFKFPALFPETLNLENINFLSHAPTGDTELANLNFSLRPDSPGVLTIETLNIPGVHRWTGISAATTFRDRNLLLTNLTMGPEIQLKTFNLDASKLDDSELGVGLEGVFFGANTILQTHIADLNATNRLSAKLDCFGFSFESLNAYLHLDLPLTGTVTQLSATFQGEPDKPAGWTGQATLRLDDLVASGEKVQAATCQANLADGQAKVTSLVQCDAKNNAQITAQAALPKTSDDFAKMAATGRLEIAAPELAILTQSLPNIVAGDAKIGANFQMTSGKFIVDGTVMADKLATGQAALSQMQLTVHLEKDLEAKGPAFRGLSTRITGGIGSVQYQDYTADALSLALSSKEGEVQVEQFALGKGSNSIRLHGDYTLPDDFQAWQNQPWHLSLGVDAPDLQAFTPESKSRQGHVQITGEASAQKGIYDGNFTINGDGIVAAGLPVQAIAGELAIVKNQAQLTNFTVTLNKKNTARAQGNVQLASPYLYKGSLDLQFTDLSVLRPLLGHSDKTPVLAGSLAISWSGQGQGDKVLQHSGSGTIDLTGGQFGEQKNLTAHFTAAYTPETLGVPDFRAGSNLGSAELVLNWKNKRLNVSNFVVRQQKLVVLAGGMDLPLDLAQYQNPAQLIPNDQPLTADLRSDNLDLRTLSSQLGQTKPPVLGTVNLKITARGTLDDLLTQLSLRATRIQSTAAANFAPADVSLDASLKDDRLTLDGTVRQQLIQPLRITGSIPLDAAKIKQAEAIDPDTPLNLEVLMPSSSLEFLSTLIPAIRQSRGSAAIDVKVVGTIAQPSLSGSVDGNLSVLRFTDPSLPPIDNFALRLDLSGDRVSIGRCRGGIAGGTFEAAGNVVFSRLDNPTLDLHVTTNNALALQNDDMTARVSSDVKVTGPLNAGAVTGTVWVTRSRFFKNVDILPIGLPGRPAPQPPPAPTVVSFPNPPLRDWKFDVAIKTKDPFLIQGNLANGSIVLDLHMGGTGQSPWMDGSVRVEQLTASLPFSRLDISSSLIYFNQAQPFVPQLDIRGSSTIRDYQIQVNIYGPITAPEAVFTSDPPLPQSEIVSLLATGMTTTELTKDPNAIAGRAAVLVFQKLYNSLFRRNKPPAEPSNSFLSRVQFDFGATDPKTGKQASTLRIPVGDQLALIGGIDVGGNFRGQIKYILRFK